MPAPPPARPGCIEVITGSMFSGKSEELIRRVRRVQIARQKVQLFKPRLDARYADLKQMSADRCPKALGALVKVAEIQFHHEVTNQHLWNRF